MNSMQREISDIASYTLSYYILVFMLLFPHDSIKPSHAKTWQVSEIDLGRDKMVHFHE